MWEQSIVRFCLEYDRMNLSVLDILIHALMFSKRPCYCAPSSDTECSFFQELPRQTHLL